jgi:glycosyltransferase involved in cell wall biosynthesis
MSIYPRTHQIAPNSRLRGTREFGRVSKPIMHIAVDMHIADRSGSERTGVGRYAIESIRALCRARPDWRFTVLSNRPTLIDAPNAAVQTTAWPTHRSGVRVAWLHSHSAWETRQLRPDLWLGTAFTLPWWWRGRSVVTIHDLMFLELRSMYSSRVHSAYASRATRWAARHADRIVCPSSETVRRLERHFGISRAKTQVVFYGVSEPFLRERSSRRDAPAEPYLLFVGAFEPRKGLPELGRAVKDLNRSREHPVRLRIAGRPGWGVGETLDQLRSDPNVELCIDPTDEELAALYTGALALVYPSRAEGFGLPVAEAMACGTPVIASDLDCIRDYALDAPLYVKPGDVDGIAAHVTRLLQDEDARHRHAARGRAVARELRWSSVGDRTATLIEQAIG